MIINDKSDIHKLRIPEVVFNQKLRKAKKWVT